MKKLYNIVLVAALLLGASSCTNLLDPSLRGLGRDQQLLEDAKVTVYFGVPEEVTTKADMAAQPSISTMHVFVFNKIGVLIETAVARKLGSVTTNGVDGAQHWAVDLQMGAAERHLHFIADLPSDFEIPNTGSEVALIQSITTKTPAAAYWQRIVLENGIDAYKYDGSGQYSYVDPNTGESHTVAVPGTVSGETYFYEDTEAGETITITVNKGDYINTSGKKVLDAKGLYASESLSRQLTLIPMIRNFARIQLTSSMSDFTIVQAALINTPKEGFVAPYNDIKNEFVWSYMHPDPAHPFTSSDIDTSGYLATVPSAGIDVPTIDRVTKKLVGVTYKTPTTVAGKDSITFYMYERSVPTANPTSLLVQGTLNGDTKWYKIEVADETGNYFPIYRDLSYVIDIQGLSAEGHSTPEEAFSGAPVGDLSSTTETKTLTQINDGKGLTLWVEYIDYTDMEGNSDEHPVTLLYKLYYKDPETSDSTNLTNYVAPYVKSYDNTDAAIKGFTTAAYTGTEPTPDGQGGWYQATVTLDGVGETMKKSDLSVYANLTAEENPGGYPKKISRDVTYRVLPKAPLTVTATELASEGANELTTVTITLPANLGYSVFPLTLMIEAANNGLMTTEGLAVETAQSITGASSHTNTFYFLKTISYSDYEDSSRVFRYDFKTTKAKVAPETNATTIYVKDKGSWFDLASCELMVRGQAPIFELSSTGVTVDPNVTTATFSIRSSSTETWELTADNENVRVNPPSGKGNRNVTVTFPRSNISSPVTHTVTAILGNDPTTALYFTIKQELTLTLSADSGEATADGGWTMPVKASETTASFRVTTNSTADWTITSNNVTSATRDGSTSTVNVTFPDNMSGSEPVTRTVTVSIGGVSKTININHLKRVPRTVTFNTNNRTGNFPNGTSSKTTDGVTLAFTNNTLTRNNNYLEISDGGSFTMSSDITITAVTINYTDYNHGHSGRNSNYSSSNPATQSGYVYATNNGTTGTWTGSSNSITFTMRQSRISNNNYNIRIASIEVTIEE